MLRWRRSKISWTSMSDGRSEMELHARKNLLVVTDRKGQPVLVARPSKSVRGAIDLQRLSGIVEHPSPKQAKEIFSKAGVSLADFDKAFGHMR